MTVKDRTSYKRPLLAARVSREALILCRQAKNKLDRKLNEMKRNETRGEEDKRQPGPPQQTWER